MIEPSIQVSSGAYFDFTSPNKRLVSIDEIAHSLSQICRFTGHCSEFYSVAQHSVLVSYLVPCERAFEGLMHDAHEAYIGDVSSPLKMLLPQYQELDKYISAAVRAQFGLPAALDPSVKAADLVMLATEQRDLFPHNPEDARFWRILHGVTPMSERLQPMRCDIAYAAFMHRYYELGGR